MTEPVNGNPGTGSQAPTPPSRDHLWAWIIGIALAVVLAVNAVFIYIAVSGADSVAPSYNTGER